MWSEREGMMMMVFVSWQRGTITTCQRSTSMSLHSQQINGPSSALSAFSAAVCTNMTVNIFNEKHARNPAWRVPPSPPLNDVAQPPDSVAESPELPSELLSSVAHHSVAVIQFKDVTLTLSTSTRSLRRHRCNGKINTIYNQRF